MTPETKAKLTAAAPYVLAWLKAHPRTIQAVGWLALGFVLGWLSGCATFDAVYWCLRSAPGTGGPFCP
ncbi:MAG: hypothetical protein U1A72_04010 [Sulfuritalea sp.]|nr:hypothetical protein [Sulfuritalea sp.]